MKTLYTNCSLPLSGGERFCTEGGTFVPALPPYDAVCDLHGAHVIPAFPDAHSHLLAYALSLLQADGSGCESAEDAAACADAFAAQNGMAEESPVTVRGVHLTPGLAAALEGHARPLVLQDRSGHAAAFNRAARALFGVDKAGVLYEGEALAAAARLPLPAERDVLRAFSRAQADYLAHGITTAQEGILQPAMFPMYEMLLRENALCADVVAYTAPAHFAEARARFDGARRFTVGGMKIFLDGSPQQKTAFLRKPYLGGGRGRAEMTEEEVVGACLHAVRERTQLLAHGNGDGAAERFLRALARLSPRERALIRPVLIHAQLAGADQLDEMKRLGVIPSFFPAHVLYWGDLHRANLGARRAERISPARSALARGIPFTLHQDTPVCPPDPLEAARCAVFRRTSSGNVYDAEAVGARDALLALTENAAAQYGFSDRGGMEAGMRADFLLLSGDPLNALGSVRVTATFLRGKQVFPA